MQWSGNSRNFLKNSDLQLLNIFSFMLCNHTCQKFLAQCPSVYSSFTYKGNFQFVNGRWFFLPLPLHKAPLQHVLSRYGDVKTMPFCNYSRTDAFENMFKARYEDKKQKLQAKYLILLTAVINVKLYNQVKIEKNCHTFQFYSQMVQKHLPDQKSVLWNSLNCINTHRIEQNNRIKQQIKNTKKYN